MTTHEGAQEKPAVDYGLPAPPASLGAAGGSRLFSWLGNAAIGWIVPLALFILWNIASQRELIPPQILPAPGAVWTTLVELASSGDLTTNIGISMQRVFSGFLVGSAAGMLLGILMGLSKRFEDYLHPTFKAISQVPVLGWLPLLMMVVGIGETLKLIIIAKASLIPVALNTLQGIRSVPKPFFEVARVYKFTHVQLLRRVVLPAAVPSIFVGIRYGLTQAWLSLVTVELLASSEGIGYLIVWGRQLFQLDLVVAAILVVGIVGLVFDRGLQWIEARLLHWRRPGV